MNWLFLACFVAFAVSWRLFSLSRLRTKGFPYVPGPRGGSIIGFRLLRGKRQDLLPWKILYDMRKVHGDIIGFNLFGRQMIVLNSYEVAKDMLKKNAAIYSDRPSMTMHGKLTGIQEQGVALVPYGAPWRERRKLLHQMVSKSAMTHFHLELRTVAHQILADALDNPIKFGQNLRFRIGAMVLKTTYGISVASPDDPFLQTAERFIRAIAAGSWGQYLVDFFPILQYVPDWIPFKREAKFWRTTRLELANWPFEYALSMQKTGNQSQSLMNNLLSSGANPDVVKQALSSLFAASVDTSVITIKAFLIAMMLYPEAQKKAQDELDIVLGTSSKNEVLRLPTFDDGRQLHYVNALVKEVLRWHIALPLGQYHAPIQDDVFRGYFIPDDSIIIPNQWGMSRDENYYHAPEEFRPERFLGDNPALDPKEYVFGFGRRICVGQHFADDNVFMIVASILSTFNISKRTGASYIAPDLRIGHASLIGNVGCDLTPRSAGAALINAVSETLGTC